MINHVRTLLMNVDGSNNPGPSFFGEQVVDPQSRQLDLPNALRRFRTVLFGSDPDRTMLNYRLAQIMPVVHTVIDGEIRQFDPRITYLDSPRPELATPASYEPEIAAIGATAGSLHVLGSPSPPDDTGRTTIEALVEITGAGQAQVTRRMPPRAQEFVSFTFGSGLTSDIPIPGTDLRARATTDAVGSSWEIRLRVPPVRSLGQIVADLQQLGEETLFGLFRETEPDVDTPRGLFERSELLPVQLSGAVLAYARRAEEVRSG